MPQEISQGTAKNLKLRVAVVVNVAIIGLIAVLFIGGALTPRGFGIAGLAAMAVCAVVWYFALKSLRRPLNASVTGNQVTRTNDKGTYIRIAVIVALLVFATWASKGGPLLPRLIGASVLMLYLFATLRGRRFQRGRRTADP
jgi:hypothetical protein